MRRPALAASLVLALLLPLAVAAAPDFAALDIQKYDSPKPAPGFSLPDLEGRLVGRAAGPRKWDSPAARTFVQEMLTTRSR